MAILSAIARLLAAIILRDIKSNGPPKNKNKQSNYLMVGEKLEVGKKMSSKKKKKSINDSGPSSAPG